MSNCHCHKNRMHVSFPLLFAKCVDVCNLRLPRLWLYTLLQLTGPESRFLLASTPLLQPVLVSLIPDGRVSDKCILSKKARSRLWALRKGPLDGHKQRYCLRHLLVSSRVILLIPPLNCWGFSSPSRMWF